MPSHQITHIKIEPHAKTNEFISHVRVSGLGRPFTEPIDTVIESLKEGQHYFIVIDKRKIEVSLEHSREGREFIKTERAGTVKDDLMLLPTFREVSKKSTR